MGPGDDVNYLLSERRIQESFILASRKLYAPFISYTMPEYQFNRHHRVIIEEVQPIVDGGQKNIMLFVPPRHGKSQLVSRHLPPFYFGKNPDKNIIFCSRTARLAMGMNRDVQRIMLSKEYAQVFPDSSFLTDKEHLRNQYQFTIPGHGGKYICSGIGGQIVGFGADLGIVDDPIKSAKEAHSASFRESSWDWFRTEFFSRLEKGASLILCLTRWHEDDIAGRLLRLIHKEGLTDQWRIISFPAIMDEKTKADDPRSLGEPLWPEKYDKKSLSEIKKMVGTYHWEALYQQRPSTPEGNIIKRAWFEKTQYIPAGTVNFYIDGAYTKESRNDPTAIMAYVKQGDFLYIKHVSVVRKEFPDLLRYLVEYVSAHGSIGSSRVYVEGKGPGQSIVQTLKKETNLRIMVDKLPNESKPARVMAVSSFIEAGRVYLLSGSWNERFIEEAASFPNGAHDDQVDCLSAVLRLSFLKTKMRILGGENIRSREVGTSSLTW